MSSKQRRRGLPVKFWPRRKVTDRRGNVKLEVDMSAAPYETTAVGIPQRGSRAEVPGQQEIDVVRFIMAALPEDAGLWARAQWMGDYWDVVAPPIYHHGTRHVRHWSIDCRRRPEDDG